MFCIVIFCECTLEACSPFVCFGSKVRREESVEQDRKSMFEVPAVHQIAKLERKREPTYHSASTRLESLFIGL